MRWNLAALFVAVVIAGGLWLGFDRFTQDGVGQSIVPTATELPAALPPLAPGEKVTFLELGGDGCPSCEAMKPVLQAVREKFPDQVEVVFLDVRKTPALAAEYRVWMIPSQVFRLPDGTEFFRHGGFFPLEDVENVLSRMGVR